MTSRNDKSTNSQKRQLWWAKFTATSPQISSQYVLSRYKFPVHFQEYATFQALCGSVSFMTAQLSHGRLRRLSQRMPQRQALRRNLPPVVPGAGSSVLVPARTAGRCQWQRLSPPAWHVPVKCCVDSCSRSSGHCHLVPGVVGEQLETLEWWWLVYYY